MKCLIFFIFLSLIQICALGGSKKAKIIPSPDKSMLARIITIDLRSDGNAESSLELRRANGSLIGIKNFVSKDHQHGLSVIKAEWTFDSNFFIFSTISSGGREPGHFPTFFYSKIDNKIHPLDPLVGIWVTDPQFFIQSPDILSVTVRDTTKNGMVADTLAKVIHLSSLQE